MTLNMPVPRVGALARGSEHQPQPEREDEHCGREVVAGARSTRGDERDGGDEAGDGKDEPAGAHEARTRR